MRSDLADDLPTLAAAALKRGFPLLRFAPMLEAAYRQAGRDERERTLATAMFFCAPLYLILLVGDHEMASDVMSTALWLRLGVFLPALALGGMTLFKMRSAQAREWLLAGLGILACLISVSIALLSQGELRIQHLVILNAIVIYTALFGRFWPMAAMCTIVFDMHVFATWHLDSLFTGIGVGTTLLLMANCTFMTYGAYLMEHSSRTSFLSDLQEARMDADLSQATDQLARIAREDALTGLANRRYFTEFLNDAHERAIRTGGPTALVLVDVDYFKAYNDHHGHPAGDECLRRIGQALTSAMGEQAALVARWGGEEFGVVLPGADQAFAGQTAERLRQAIMACGIPHAASPTGNVVTASLGVAALAAGRDGTVTELITAADKALYVSKTSGRNRVTATAMATREPGDKALACVGNVAI